MAGLIALDLAPATPLIVPTLDDAPLLLALLSAAVDDEPAQRA